MTDRMFMKVEYTPEQEVENAAKKEQRVGVFMQSGMSRSDAIIADDFGNRAIEAALEAAERVITTLPEHLREETLGMALGGIKEHCEHMLSVLRDERMDDLNLIRALLDAAGVEKAGPDAVAKPGDDCDCPACVLRREYAGGMEHFAPVTTH